MNIFIKNILAGMGSLLVISPANSVELIDPSDFTHQSPQEALRSDWEKVGRDLRSVNRQEDVVVVKK